MIKGNPELSWTVWQNKNRFPRMKRPSTKEKMIWSLASKTQFVVTYRENDTSEKKLSLTKEILQKLMESESSWSRFWQQLTVKIDGEVWGSNYLTPKANIVCFAHQFPQFINPVYYDVLYYVSCMHYQTIPETARQSKHFTKNKLLTN